MNDDDIVTKAKYYLCGGGLSLLGGEEALFLCCEDYIRFVKDCQHFVNLHKKFFIYNSIFSIYIRFI